MLNFLYNFLVEKVGVNMTYEIKENLGSPSIYENKKVKEVTTKDEDSVLRSRVRHRKYSI